MTFRKRVPQGIITLDVSWSSVVASEDQQGAIPHVLAFELVDENAKVLVCSRRHSKVFSSKVGAC